MTTQYSLLLFSAILACLHFAVTLNSTQLFPLYGVDK